MGCLLQGPDRHSQGQTNHNVSGSIRSGELKYVCIYFSFQPCEKRAENQKKKKVAVSRLIPKVTKLYSSSFSCFVKSVLDQCRIFMYLHISLLSKLLSVSLSECWFIIKSVNPFTFSCFIHFRGFKSSLLGRCLLIISLKPKVLLSMEASNYLLKSFSFV